MGLHRDWLEHSALRWGNPLTPDHSWVIERVSEVDQLPKRAEKNQTEAVHNAEKKHTAGPALVPLLELPLCQ